MRQHYPNHAGELIDGSRRNSNSDHRTPAKLFAALSLEVGGFTLDAAASAENALCDEYFTQELNALVREWGTVEEPARVWCNPPYARDLNGGVGSWIAKAASEVRSGRVSVAWLLLPARCSVKWFHDALQHSTECRIIEGRLSFTGPFETDAGRTGGAPFGSVLFRFGGDSAGIMGANRQGQPQHKRYSNSQKSLDEWGAN